MNTQCREAAPRRQRQRQRRRMLLLIMFCCYLSATAATTTTTTGAAASSTATATAAKTSSISSGSSSTTKSTKSAKPGPTVEAKTQQPTTNKKVKKTTQAPSTIKRSSDTRRRIEREFQDAVQAGIAYHWQKQRPINNNNKKKSSSRHIWLGPLSPMDLFVWHFTMTGLPGSVYEEGVYHGRLVLPRTYPAHPPRVQLWTPSGRFVPRADICLSASHYHPETWRPNLSMMSLIEALRLHMATAGNEIASMHDSYEARLEMAMKSREFECRVRSSSSKQRQQRGSKGIVVIDHARMIQQGLIDGISSTGSTHDAVVVVVATEEQDQETTSHDETAVVVEAKAVGNGEMKDTATVPDHCVSSTKEPPIPDDDVLRPQKVPTTVSADGRNQEKPSPSPSMSSHGATAFLPPKSARSKPFVLAKKRRQGKSLLQQQETERRQRQQQTPIAVVNLAETGQQQRHRRRLIRTTLGISTGLLGVLLLWLFNVLSSSAHY